MKVWTLQDIDVDIAAVVRWMQAEADARGLPVRLHADRAFDRGGFLYVPATASNAGDLLAEVNAMQDIEDAWNNRDPKPVPTVIVTPASMAVRLAEH